MTDRRLHLTQEGAARREAILREALDARSRARSRRAGGAAFALVIATVLGAWMLTAPTRSVQRLSPSRSRVDLASERSPTPAAAEDAPMDRVRFVRIETVAPTHTTLVTTRRWGEGVERVGDDGLLDSLAAGGVRAGIARAGDRVVVTGIEAFAPLAGGG